MPPTPSRSMPATLALLISGVLASVVVGQLVGSVLMAAAGVPWGPEASEFLSRPGVLAAMTGAQYAAMTGVAFGLARGWLGSPRAGLGARPVSVRHLGAGFAAGVAALGVASGLGALLLEWFPGLELGGLEQLGEAFSTGSPGPRAALVLVVSLGAPLAEEWIFRGVLWEALERRFGPRATFVVTSLVFAAWHVRPFHALTLLPTAFLFGWLRLKTGSVLPSLVAHAVNNAVGAVLLVTLGADSDAPFAAAPFLCGLVLYVSVLIGVGRRGPDPSASAP